MRKTLGLLGLLTAAMATAQGCPLLWKEAYVEIYDMQVLISQERPASVQIQIKGATGDPTCTKLLPPQQERQGKEIRILMRAQERVGVVCPAILKNFMTTVPIVGKFSPGVYRITVSAMANSVEKEFEIVP